MVGFVFDEVPGEVVELLKNNNNNLMGFDLCGIFDNMSGVKFSYENIDSLLITEWLLIEFEA
jgi:hypothetical protein